MPTILEQLRAAQRDAGITAPAHPEDEVIILGTKLARLNPEYLAMKGHIRSHLRSEPPVHIGPAPTGVAGGGYIKIFPPTFQTIRDINPEWIAANWTAPSPWCRVEGLPDHPEFEANLAGVER